MIGVVEFTEGSHFKKAGVNKTTLNNVSAVLFDGETLRFKCSIVDAVYPLEAVKEYQIKEGKASENKVT